MAQGNHTCRGQQRDKPFRAALQLAINEASAKGGKKLREVAEALVERGIAGDVPAIKEIADRLDGRVPQAVVGDSGEDPINHLVRREIIDVIKNVADDNNQNS